MLRMVVAVMVGLLLLGFGAIGLRSAREIVATQDEHGLALRAGEAVPTETRVRLTRYMAVLVILLGILCLVYAGNRLL